MKPNRLISVSASVCVLKFFAVLCLFGKGSHFIDKLVEKLKRIVHGCAVVISTPAIFRTEMGSMLLPALRNLM